MKKINLQTTTRERHMYNTCEIYLSNFNIKSFFSSPPGLIILIIFFYILMDTFTTYIALSVGAYEANPLMKYILENYSWVGFISFKIIILSCLSILAYKTQLKNLYTIFIALGIVTSSFNIIIIFLLVL